MRKLVPKNDYVRTKDCQGPMAASALSSLDSLMSMLLPRPILFAVSLRPPIIVRCFFGHEMIFVILYPTIDFKTSRIPTVNNRKSSREDDFIPHPASNFLCIPHPASILSPIPHPAKPMLDPPIPHRLLLLWGLLKL